MNNQPGTVTGQVHWTHNTLTRETARSFCMLFKFGHGEGNAVMGFLKVLDLDLEVHFSST